MTFQIPAGDSHALVAWSVQGNVDRFVFDWNTVKPHLQATRAVKGDYTPYGALCELLQGTGLSFRYVPGEKEWGRQETYYVGVENSGPIPAYDEVCPTLTLDTPSSIDPPRANWR